MYLPHEIPGAQVLIAVKTYPQPSGKYDELVCTAGFLPDGRWIRLYPIPFRALPYQQQYEKYHWITLDVIRNFKDFRPESYRPKHGVEGIRLGEKLNTKDGWAERKAYALKEVFTSMEDLLQRAKGEEKKSLAVLKPREILDFVMKPTEREWKPEWQKRLLQLNLFDRDEKGEGQKRRVLPKLPYKYFYRFLTEGDKNPRQLMIEDWEIGALYWKCFRRCGDEKEANRLVQQKFYYEFCSKNDLYFFLGTTLQYHNISAQPFMIIGVFYPPKPPSQSEEKRRADPIDTKGLHQPPLFEF